MTTDADLAPITTGTDKQIAWATDIRQQWADVAVARIAKAQGWLADGIKTDLAAERIAEAQAHLAALTKITDAKMIIDSRAHVRDCIMSASRRGVITKDEAKAAYEMTY